MDALNSLATGNTIISRSSRPTSHHRCREGVSRNAGRAQRPLMWRFYQPTGTSHIVHLTFILRVILTDELEDPPICRHKGHNNPAFLTYSLFSSFGHMPAFMNLSPQPHNQCIEDEKSIATMRSSIFHFLKYLAYSPPMLQRYSALTSCDGIIEIPQTPTNCLAAFAFYLCLARV